MAAAITQSLVDRLIDDDPNGSIDAVESDMAALTRYKIGLRRDLENLLNTRRPWLPLLDGFAGLDRTILGYGVPDFSTEDMSVPAVRDRTRRAIAQTIRDHEPRLAGVEVEMDDGPNWRGMRLRISAVLHLARSSDPVVYEASVRPNDRAIEVVLAN